MRTVAPPLPKTIEKNAEPWNVFNMDYPERVRVLDDSTLRLKIVKRAHGSESGATFRCDPSNSFPVERCTMEYEVYFPKDFDWVRGGKLPGMSLGEGPRDSATGGGWSSSAGSVRLMWREGGSVVAYLYLPFGSSRKALLKQKNAYQRNAKAKGTAGHELWGPTTGGGLTFEKGTWNRVSLAADLPGGTMTLTVNDRTKTVPVVWRATEKVKINHAIVVAFFGGSDDSWNSPVDTSITFRNFSWTLPS